MIEQSLKALSRNSVFSRTLEELAKQKTVEIASAAQAWGRISAGINSRMLGVSYPKNPEDINFFMWGTVVGIVLGFLGMIQSRSGKDTEILRDFTIFGAVVGAGVDFLEQQTNTSALNLMTFIPRLFNLFR